MGSWKHWSRNVGPLSERFTVHALDHPAYGDSASIPRETTGPQYLDLMHELFVEAFPGAAPLRFAGFSFGGAIAAELAWRLALSRRPTSQEAADFRAYAAKHGMSSACRILLNSNEFLFLD